MKTEKKLFGVFKWNPEGRYPHYMSLRVFKRELNARRYADKVGNNHVVREWRV